MLLEIIMFILTIYGGFELQNYNFLSDLQLD